MALFGSTLVSAARYFVGSWFPSLEELTYNKVSVEHSVAHSTFLLLLLHHPELLAAWRSSPTTRQDPSISLAPDIDATVCLAVTLSCRQPGRAHLQ